MANKHYNGPEPVVMLGDDYDRQAELWKAAGGNIRDDGPHTGANYDHSHWFDGNNKNEDFVCVREDDPDDPDDSEDDNDDEDW